MKRTGKFYYSNEKKTLLSLGLTPIPGSGSGWIHKEDGENDEVLVQLKSTDYSSYRINLLDIKKLEYHSLNANKIPVFLIQFLKENKIYALVSVSDIKEISDSLFCKKPIKKVFNIEENETEVQNERKVVKSSVKSGEKFYEEKEKMKGGRKWQVKK